MTTYGGTLVVAWALLAACGDTTTATRTDLRAYLSRARSWAPTEAEENRAIARILQTQFVDEAEVLHQIAASRPRILAHLERVRGYEPRTQAIGRIHARYVAAWQHLLDGYAAIEQGFATGDYTGLARGREAMEAWRAVIESVAHELRDLADHLGVDPAAVVESRVRPPPGHSEIHRTKSRA